MRGDARESSISARIVGALAHSTKPGKTRPVELC